MKIENMVSYKGQSVPNQFIISADNGRYMQSYNSIVVFIPNKTGEKVQLGADWDFSRTTMKYVSLFLGTSAKEIRQKIKNGEYIVNENLGGIE